MPPAEAPPRPDRPAAAPRRTVVIRGQVAPPPRASQPARPAAARRAARASASPARRPDRAALWAVMMGVFLILVAVITAHGA